MAYFIFSHYSPEANIPIVPESARACSYFLSKVKGGTGNLSLLVANALAVNVLAVNNVFQGVSHSDFVHF